MQHPSSNSFENEVHAMPAPPTEEQVQRARRVVASMAVDADEARILLAMCGIN